MKSIGIIGFGIVGKSALAFLRSPECRFNLVFLLINQSLSDNETISIAVWDKRTISEDERGLINHAQATDATGSNDLAQFCAAHDLLIVSAGVDIRLLAQYHSKVVTELDLYTLFFKGTTFAITGTIGKTTITQLTAEILNAEALQSNAFIAGNIGKGLLDLVPLQKSIGITVAELSSFQLEHTKKFVPHIAIWSNLYENHLDRHGDMASYCSAKAKIMIDQTESDYAIIGAQLMTLESMKAIIVQMRSSLYVVAAQQPSHELLVEIEQMRQGIIMIENDWVMSKSWRTGSLIVEQLMQLSIIPSVGFLENWLLALGAAYAAGKNLDLLDRAQLEIAYEKAMAKIGANRLELCGSVDGIDFYNDSKATVIQATQAALTKLDELGRPMIVMLGGVSKGVDRRPLVYFLKNLKNLKSVICFGPVYSEFDIFKAYPTLEDAFEKVVASAEPGDLVLFSPSGASFDLFNNYTHRGVVYKDLVKGYIGRVS